MPRCTFRRFLRQREHDDTAIGDLARDVRDDGIRYVKRLDSADACIGAYEALDAAEREWRASR